MLAHVRDDMKDSDIHAQFHLSVPPVLHFVLLHKCLLGAIAILYMPKNRTQRWLAFPAGIVLAIPSFLRMLASLWGMLVLPSTPFHCRRRFYFPAIVVATESIVTEY
jgi:hypothetical protein